MRRTIITQYTAEDCCHVTRFVSCFYISFTIISAVNTRGSTRTEITTSLWPNKRDIVHHRKNLKLAKRHLERIWSRTHSFEDLKNLRSATNHYHAAIIKAKQPIILLSFHPALLILVNFGKIYQYTSSSLFFTCSTLL